jgi:tetratricopeptide (TPR) repeat protein
MAENNLPTNTEIDPKNLQGGKSGILDSIKNLSVKKILFVALALGLIIMIVFGVSKFLQSKSPNLATDIKNADSAFKSGDYDKANEIIDKNLTKYPHNPHLNAAKVNLISQEGNLTGDEANSFKQLQPYIEKSLLNGGDKDPNILLSVGYAYETAGDYQKALEYYEKGLKIDPNSAALWFNKGHIMEFLGDFEESQSAYNKAYELNKEDSAILIAIGHQLVRENKIKEAFDIYIKASNLKNITNQQKADALTEASFVRRSQDSFSHLPEALELSQRAISFAPKYSPALGVHGHNLYLMGRRDEAIEVMGEAIAANPRIAKNFFYRGGFYRAKKDYSDAINHFKQAISAVDTDNTILPLSDKAPIKAKFIYELARTYHISGIQVNPSDLIISAIELDPNIKRVFNDDVNQNGYFESYLTDQRLAVYLD